jgi:hypothetical protein
VSCRQVLRIVLEAGIDKRLLPDPQKPKQRI